MKKFEENDLVEYINQVGIVHCSLSNHPDTYIINFRNEDSIYSLIAQEKDIKLISKYNKDKVFKEGDKVITLKGKGIIKSIDIFDQNIIYEILINEIPYSIFKYEVWEDV